MTLNHCSLRLVCLMGMIVMIGGGLLISNLLADEVQPVAVTSVRLVLPAQAGPVVENAGKVFARQVQQRCGAKVVTAGEIPPVRVTLAALVVMPLEVACPTRRWLAAMLPRVPRARPLAVSGDKA